MMLLPFLDRLLPRKLAHFVACSFAFAVVGAAGWLTVQAMNEDAHNTSFQESRKKADAAPRAVYLAGHPEVGSRPMARPMFCAGTAHSRAQRAGTALPRMPLL